MTTQPEHTIRRSGLKTSEFWLSLLAIAVSAVLPAFSDAVGEYLKATPHAALAPAIVALGYGLSRGLVKKSRNDASAAAQMPETVNVGTAVNNAAPVEKEPVE